MFQISRSFRVAALLLAAATSTPATSRAADAAPKAQGTPAAAGVVVSNVKVLTDHVHDVSSPEAWRASFTKPGMTEREKALAVWESVVAYRHQAVPPTEYLNVEDHPIDPIKVFNVYGYNMCNGASGGIVALAREAGLEARGWAIMNHSVPEVKVDGRWALLDASLVNYFEQPDGTIAGVEEIGQSVERWYEQHPALRNDDAALRKLQQSKGWTGWRAGPGLIVGSKWFDAGGWWPAGTHGWYATMQEYGNLKKSHVYEYGTALGYRVNLQLRPGERITRNWSNKGLHVNMLEGKDCDVLKAVPGRGDMKYSPKFGDLAPGRIGNGTHAYAPPLASGAYRAGALVDDNLATRAEANAADGPALRVKDVAKPGVYAFRVPSSYVYLGGELTFDAVVAPGGSVAVAFSENSGLDWRDVATVTASGPQRVDIKPLVYRRYDYRLRFTLAGGGTGLDAVKVTHDIQHSQRPLPILAQGDNTVRFAVGPQEGTVTVEGSTKPESKGKNLLYTDFHPTVTGIKPGTNIRPEGGTGEVTFPIATPGDMVRLRVGAHYRARDAKDGWDVLASFDAGKTWRPVGKLDGPYAGMSRYFTLADVPAGTRSALVKFAGRQRNTLVLFDARIDADYREPAGGFAPVKVTYEWEENGQGKRHVHIAKAAGEAYTIRCDAKPAMKSITLELAE